VSCRQRVWRRRAALVIVAGVSGALAGAVAFAVGPAAPVPGAAVAPGDGAGGKAAPSAGGTVAPAAAGVAPAGSSGAGAAVPPGIGARATPGAAGAGIPAGPAAGPAGGTGADAAAATPRQTAAPLSAPGAAACRLSLTPERASLTLGVDSEVRVDATLSGCESAGARPGRPQVTVGVLEPFQPAARAGAFTSVFHAPRERFPQAALLATEVVLPSGVRLHATATIALPATTTFPLRTEPRASVTLEVAGQSFGPVTASATGMVAIPIVVPPGVDHGRAVALGRFGGEKDMQVNLQIRDYPRVLIIAPADAEAGATLQVGAWAVEPTGVAAVPEDIDLRASLGTVRRTGGGPGEARFVVTLPRDAAEGAVQLTASTSDGSSEHTEAVALHPGPPAVLAVTSSLPQLVVGSAEVATVEISARDRWDNDTSVSGVTVTLDDRPLPVTGDDEAVTARIPAPTTWLGHEKTVIVARLGKAETRRELLVTGGPAAGVHISASRDRVAADGHATVQLLAEVSDRRGTPTSTSRIVWTTSDDGMLVAEPPPRFGTYAARFTPNPALHDRTAVIDAVVDPDLRARQRIQVDTAPAPVATARVGLISNFGGLFGQTAFLEAALPYPARRGPLRLFSVGLSVGYIHGEANSEAVLPSRSTVVQSETFQTEMNQLPLLASLRMHVPAGWPVELSVAGLLGVTWMVSSTTDLSTGSGVSSGSAMGWVLGLGTDLALPLKPGEFLIGVRYLNVAVGRLSNGDRLSGNAGGLVADLGFRLRL